MTISNETLKAIIREYQGLEMTDEELEIMRPEIDSYLAEVEKLRELDLSSVLSVRLLQAREDG